MCARRRGNDNDNPILKIFLSDVLETLKSA